MKYWNKQKQVRQTHWHAVDYTPPKMNSVGANGSRATFTFPETHQDLKKWCQDQPSTGRFYNYYGSHIWWFEYENDALMFVLKWCR